jgi:MFS family permease
MTAPPSLFANRSFSLLALSSFVSLLGDQLSLIALPWLVLSLSGDAAAVGLMLALIGAPRAVFLLIGGAQADRRPPQQVLTLTRSVSLILMLVLALLTWASMATIPVLYLFATALGLSSALGMPAGTSLMPRLLPKEQLAAGNGVVMAGAQLSALLGPVAAGLILSVFERSAGGNTGFALVFALDALTFAVSLTALQFMRLSERSNAPVIDASILAYLSAGWCHLRTDRSLMMFVLYIGLINLFTIGPVMVGVPVLVKTELGGGVWEYGAFLSVMNFGVLVAMLLGGRLPALPARLFTRTVLVCDAVMGALMYVFVNVTAALAHQGILFAVGLLAGYIQVSLITRIQRRTAGPFQGRVMSYVMFAYLGLVPVSASLAGFLMTRMSVRAMFELMGFLIVVVAITFMLNRHMPRIAEEPVPSTR